MGRERFLGLYANFDPKLIVLQMTCHQLVYYCGLFLFYLLFDTSFGVKVHMGQFFHYSIYNTEHSYGMICLLANFFNMFIVILGLIFITEKANKVLDFVFTIYLFHFVVCMLYNKMLWLSWSWYIANGIFMTITILLGEYILIKIEQQEILLFENLMTPSTDLSTSKNDSDGIELNNKSTFSEPKDVKIDMPTKLD